MDERYLVALLGVLAVTGLFVIVSQARTIDDLREEVLVERAYTDYVLNEYATICGDLGRQVKSLESNLTRSQADVEACLDRLPIVEGVPPITRVGLENLIFSEDHVIIDVDDLIPGIVADGRSMFPSLGNGTVVLELEPRHPAEISVGDVVIYELEGTRIIHRVVEVGRDSKGWYAIAKGDNNPIADPERVRFDQIRGIVVGVVY